MIYLVKNGVTMDADTVYCTVDSVAKRCSRVYMAEGGKTKLLWEKGTRDHPFVLRKAEDFDLIANHPAAHFVLGNDIEIKINYNPDSTMPIYPDCLPILQDVPFRGVLDGQGHKIRINVGVYIRADQKKVTISDGQTAVGAMFGINRGIITRLCLDLLTNIKFDYTSPSYGYGMICGENFGTIDQVKADFYYRPIDSGNVEYYQKNPIKSAGLAYCNRGTIQSCDVFNGASTAKKLNYLGGFRSGIAYENYGTIQNVSVKSNDNSRYSMYEGLIYQMCYENKSGGKVLNSTWLCKNSYVSDIAVNKGVKTNVTLGSCPERATFDKIIY